MEIKRLDATPYLMADEKVLYKTSAKPSRSRLIQIVLCYVFALIALAGDSFLLAMTYALNNDLKNVNSFLMPLEICLVAIHLIPFAFWMGNVLQSSKKKGGKWYALTNKRVLTIEGSKPVTLSIVNIEEITSLRVGKDVVSLSLGEEMVTLSGLSDPKAFGDKILELFGDAKSEVGKVKSTPAETPQAPAENKVEALAKNKVEAPVGEPEVIIAEVGVSPEMSAEQSAENKVEAPAKDSLTTEQSETANAEEKNGEDNATEENSGEEKGSEEEKNLSEETSADENSDK